MSGDVGTIAASLMFPLNDYPHGAVACMDCGTPIPPGAPYSLRLDSFDEVGEDWSDVVCATGYCKASRTADVPA